MTFSYSHVTSLNVRSYFCDAGKIVTGDRGQMSDQFIYSSEDLKVALDALLADRSKWWDGFFSDRNKPIPFFVEWPDENLAAWFDAGLLKSGRVLELGCGNGRNALYLAEQGYTVDAVDFSAEAIQWAEERAKSANISVNFECASIFDKTFEEGSYDLVYDSGCFHHLPPHRRKDYVDLVGRALKPGGNFGLVCFRPEGGSGYTDLQVYERRSLGGGIGYSEEQLRLLWDARPFSVDVLRTMTKKDVRDSLFGEDFLWALLATKGFLS